MGYFAERAARFGYTDRYLKAEAAWGDPPSEANKALFREHARQVCCAMGVPTSMFFRQIDQESGWNPCAVSNVGAVGISQFMPDWWKQGQFDPWNPFQALDRQAQAMASYRQNWGSWRWSLCVYNAGPGNVGEGGCPPYGGAGDFIQTKDYLDSILGPGWPEPPASADCSNPPVCQDCSCMACPCPECYNTPPGTGVAVTAGLGLSLMGAALYLYTKAGGRLL